MRKTARPRRKADVVQGLHLVADLWGCAPDQPWMHDDTVLAEACLTLVGTHGLRQVGQLFHRFTPREAGQPSGLTGVLLVGALLAGTLVRRPGRG